MLTNLFRTAILLISTLLAALVAASPIARAEGDASRFPREHEDLLSAGAHALLFEHGRQRAHDVASQPREIARAEGRGMTDVRMNSSQCAPNSVPCVPLGALGRSETTVAATNDGELIVGAWNNADGLLRPPFADVLPGAHGVTAYGVSVDGGRTWTDRGAPPAFRAGADSIITASDPWLDRGGKDESTFYFANLALNDDDAPPPGQDAATGDGDGDVVPRGISVHRGHFRDENFVWEDGHLIEPPHAGDLYDKDAIAMAKDGSGAGYVTISNFLALCGKPAFGFGQIEVWRTQDSGNTWSGPAVAGPDLTFHTANQADPNCGDGGVLQTSSSPAIGPAGEVYVAWQRGPTLTVGAASPTTDIVVARSMNGGASFEAPVNVNTINSMRQDPPVGFNKTRINDHPRIAVATSGRNRGRVYVTFPSAVTPVPSQGQPRFDACPLEVTQTRFLLCVPQALTSIQVFVSYSDDHGRTWSAPTPLASPVPPTGLKRWWPVVSVEPGGAVDVVYNESQEKSIGTTCDVHMSPLAIDLVHEIGPAVSLVDTFRVRSVDGGLTFGPPTKLSTTTSSWCATRSDISANFGDYIGSAAVGGGVLAAWSDGRAGVPDAFFAAVRGEEGR